MESSPAKIQSFEIDFDDRRIGTSMNSKKKDKKKLKLNQIAYMEPTNIPGVMNMQVVSGSRIILVSHP